MLNTTAHFQLRRFLARIGLLCVSGFIFLVVWTLVSLFVTHVRGAPFPGPLETIASFYRLLTNRETIYQQTIWIHIRHSMGRWLLGYSIAIVLGVAMGAFLGSVKTAHAVFMPLVYTLQLIPGIAWIPIALLLFGLGNPSTVFMVSMVAVSPIIINTATGIRSTPQRYLWAARMMGAGRVRIFFEIVIPASVLSILSGLRIGLANAWRVLVAAEMIVGTGIGLGYIIIESRWSLNFKDAFVCIMIICLIGLTVEKVIFGAIEKWAMRTMGFSREEP